MGWRADPNSLGSNRQERGERQLPRLGETQHCASGCKRRDQDLALVCMQYLSPLERPSHQAQQHFGELTGAAQTKEEEIHTCLPSHLECLLPL